MYLTNIQFAKESEKWSNMSIRNCKQWEPI